MSFGNIPKELTTLAQWLLWKLVIGEDGKPTKVPYNLAGYPCDVTKRSNWANFEAAVNAAQYGYDGIGFVFTGNDGHSGIDLDNKGNDPNLKLKHEEIYSYFDSYTEFSPSGTGLHIIVRGTVPRNFRIKEFGMEVYSRDRFFTFTGKVFNGAKSVIADRSTLLIETLEYAQAYAPAENSLGATLASLPETQDDQTLWNVAANAVNGTKFQALWAGRTDGFPSQSEADQALMNIIAYYTDNREQAVRMFRASGLGQRDKAKRNDYVSSMVKKAWDRKLPPIDLAALEQTMANLKNEEAPTPGDAGASTAAAKTQDARALAPIVVGTTGNNPFGDDLNMRQGIYSSRSKIPVPPGMMGEIADFIYRAAPRPVAEIAIAGAIGFMAGLCGRAWNINGTGLNLYTLLLAGTGRGKEAMSSGIDKMMREIEKEVPAAKDFMGPSVIASGAGLFKEFDASRRGTGCFLSILGEFHTTLQVLQDPRASASVITLRKMLLDFFNKSGHGNVARGMAYSDREKNIADIKSPAFSILAEATPERVYELLDEDMVAEGMLPRMIIIPYDGPRVPTNENIDSTVPPVLVEKLRAIATTALMLMQKGMVQEVKQDSEAWQMLKRFDAYADSRINSSEGSVVTVELWNRAHVKALKLSALVAVGIHPYSPVITKEIADWAIWLVNNEIEHLVNKFSRGEIGGNNHESKQKRVIQGGISTYVRTDPELLVKKYGKNIPLTAEMAKRAIIPRSFLMQYCAGKPFREDRRPNSAILNDILQELVDSGDLRPITPVEMNSLFGKAVPGYAILKAPMYYNMKEEIVIG